MRYIIIIIQVAADVEVAHLKSLLEKSRNDYQASVKQLEQLKQDLNKLNADKQSVRSSQFLLYDKILPNLNIILLWRCHQTETSSECQTKDLQSHNVPFYAPALNGTRYVTHGGMARLS